MPGSFILKSISATDLHVATSKPGITWSALWHAPGTGTPPFPGWCPATRQRLATALGSHAIPNRHGLPPHRYLEIATWGQLDDATRRYVTSAGWDQFLIRPTGAGLGLTALTQAANQFWNQGDRSAALREQCRFGPVSIEVYYLSGIEMA